MISVLWIYFAGNIIYIEFAYVIDDMTDGEMMPPEAVLADNYYAPVELGTVD